MGTEGGGSRTGPLDLGFDLSGWVDVCPLDQIADQRGLAIVVRGTDVALMRDGSEVHALGGTCPHRGGQIADGRVVDGDAICPLHLWDFDLATGISTYNPADRLARYDSRVVDGLVQIDADTVPRGPGHPEEYLGPWLRRGATDRGMHLVHSLANGATAPVTAMGTTRLEPASASSGRYPSLDDLVFLPAQVARLPLLDDEPVDTTVRLGTRAQRPLTLATPLVISHMSFGALSRQAKIALSVGAASVGTAVCSGEGGVLADERTAGGQYVLEMASGYFGFNETTVRDADAVEIKVGQGAKPGMGGVLPASKVTPEIADARGIPLGRDSHSPSRFPDIDSLERLAGRIRWIRSINPQIPVGIKIASGRVLDDVAAAIEAGADYLIIDGLGGGTGAAPVHVRNHVGIPSWVAVRLARQWLDQHQIDDVQIVATGGFRTPSEFAKVLALGADAVAVATAAMMAIGCQQYRACHRGTCPVGIATQDPMLAARLDPEVSAARLVRFLTTSTSMMTDYCRITGRRSFGELRVEDLSALHPDTARLLDIGLMR